MSEKPPSDVPLPYADRPVATAPGHWVLARAGKRVLRPGGAARAPAQDDRKTTRQDSKHNRAWPKAGWC